MTRIIRPTTAHSFNPPTSTLNQPHRPPDPQAIKQLEAILDAPKDTAEASQSGTSPDAPLLHPYHTLAFLAHRRHTQYLESQGGQAALDKLAEGRFSKAHLLATVAQHTDNLQALAGFFAALGPQHTLDALQSMDHYDRDVISSGYGPLLDPARRYGWLSSGHLQDIHLVEAFHRDRLQGQRETLARALSQAVTGGLNDAFIQELANTASRTPKTANQLSQLFAQSDGAALIPSKEAFYNHLMIPKKALSPVNDSNTRGWVRAATLLLGDNPSAHWLEPLQNHVGSAGLSQFMTTTVQDTINIIGKSDRFPYGDEDYQRGLEGLLRGLSQRQGEEYTELKAHVFSAASDAMGETHTREELTEGLKELFVSDPKEIAMKIEKSRHNDTRNDTAFSYFFKEAVFNNPDPNDKFFKVISLTLKDLYQETANNSLSEIENTRNAKILGHLFGSLQVAFESAKSDNKTDQASVGNGINALVGLAAIFPQISTQLSATKDGIVVPILDTVFNINNRRQAQYMNLVDDKFDEIEDAMLAGFNGYEEDTNRRVGNDFDSGSNRVHRRASEALEQN